MRSYALTYIEFMGVGVGVGVGCYFSPYQSEQYSISIKNKVKDHTNTALIRIFKQISFFLLCPSYDVTVIRYDLLVLIKEC